MSDCVLVFQGKLMALMFYEVSTRTNCSFQAAVQRLGGRTVTMDTNTSSVKKGETLEGKDSLCLLGVWLYCSIFTVVHREK